MNKCILIGRLTRDPELRYTQSGTPVCSESLAVRRPTARDGEDDADFINITVWGKAAENLAKYKRQGGQIAIEGRLQVSNYTDREGAKRWKTEVVANSVEFLGSKEEGMDTQPQQQTYQQPQQQVNQMTHDYGQKVMFNDEDLPF